MAGLSRIPFDPQLGIESVSLDEAPPPTLAPFFTPVPSLLSVGSELETLFAGYRLGTNLLDSLAPDAVALREISERSFVLRDQILLLREKCEAGNAAEVASFLAEDHANHELLAVLRRALLSG